MSVKLELAHRHKSSLNTFTKTVWQNGVNCRLTGESKVMGFAPRTTRATRFLDSVSTVSIVVDRPLSSVTLSVQFSTQFWSQMDAMYDSEQQSSFDSTMTIFPKGCKTRRLRYFHYPSPVNISQIVLNLWRKNLQFKCQIPRSSHRYSDPWIYVLERNVIIAKRNLE